MIAQNVPHCVCQKSDPATSIEDSMRRATQREIPGALYGAEQIARRAMRAAHGRLGLSAAQTDPLRHFNIGQGDRLDRHDEPSSPTIACCILRLPVLAPAASKIRICNNDALRAFNCNRICFCCSRSGTSGDRYGGPLSTGSQLCFHWAAGPFGWPANRRSRFMYRGRA